MKKRLLSILIATLLLMNLVPMSVSATQAIRLDPITHKSPGEQVIITGTTTLNGATLQVKRPNATILYVDIIDQGKFTKVFNLPQESPTGIYEVVVGKGSEYIKETFKVKPRVGGSSDNTDSEPSKPRKPKVESNKDGSVNVKVETKISGKRAKIILDSSTIDEAYNQSKKDKKGFKKMVVEVSEVADEYAIELPSDAVKSDTANQKTSLKTPLGSITIQNNMFTSDKVKGKDKVTLSIGFADKSSIKKQTMDQIGNRPVIEVNAKLDEHTASWNNPHAPVQIALNYKPSAEELKNPEHIVVWYIDDEGNVISIPNGKYDPEAGQVIFTITHFSTYAVAFVNQTFSDIEDYSWAKKEIEVMASKGVINGTSASTYNPEKNITRAEFMSLLVRTLELNADFNTNFDDVKSTDYYYEALGIAKELGITIGVGHNKYNPKDEISRQDMMVLVTRALKIAGRPIITETDIKGFIDIHPKDTATRAEAAVIMYRVLNK